MAAYFQRYLGIAFIICIAFMLFNVFSSTGTKMGFWGWCVFILLGSLLTALGTLLGRFFLNFTRPDAFFSSGAMDSFWKKIFWSIGPQFIGGSIGLLLTINYIINWFEVAY